MLCSSCWGGKGVKLSQMSNFYHNIECFKKLHIFKMKNYEESADFEGGGCSFVNFILEMSNFEQKENKSLNLFFL